jgi:hypothetical protein
MEIIDNILKIAHYLFGNDDYNLDLVFRKDQSGVEMKAQIVLSYRYENRPPLIRAHISGVNSLDVCQKMLDHLKECISLSIDAKEIKIQEIERRRVDEKYKLEQEIQTANIILNALITKP